MNDTGATILGALVVILGSIAVFLGIFALFTIPTAIVVWLAWNVLGLHDVFGAAPLTFWQTIGAAVGINILRSIFSRKFNG